MKARARVCAEATARGTRVDELRSEPPLVLRETAEGLYLVGAAGGPLGGDEVALEISVGAGACLRVRSAAATLAQPGPSGAPSRSTTTIAVGPGASVSWEPEPLVSVRGSHHHIDTSVELAADARLVLVEEVVLGRFGENSGRVTTRLRVHRDGHPLVAHDLDLGPGAAAWNGPAVIGSARVVRTELHVGLCVATAPVVRKEGSARAAIFPIAPGASMLVALGDSLTEARHLARDLARTP